MQILQRQAQEIDISSFNNFHLPIKAYIIVQPSLEPSSRGGSNEWAQRVSPR